MGVPTWVTVVGVFMLLIGGCGTYNNINKINMPTTLKQSAEILNNISVEINRTSNSGVRPSGSPFEGEESLDSLALSMEETLLNDSAGMEVFENLFGSIEKMMVFTDYYQKWIVRLGYIGLGVSLIYFLAGLFMVMGKPFALKLSFVSLALSLGFMIFQIIVMSMDKEGGAVGRWSTSFGSYFMIFINVVLLIILTTANKEFFYQHEIIQE